jgi:hypothetical protein
VAGVGVDVVGLEVVAVDKAVALVMHVLVSVVLEALSIKVLPEGSVRQVS